MAQFHEFDMVNVGPLTAQWAEENEEALKKLVEVCKIIVAKVKLMGRPFLASFSGMEGEPLMLVPIEEGEDYPTPSEEMKALLLDSQTHEETEGEGAGTVDEEAYLADRE